MMVHALLPPGVELTANDYGRRFIEVNHTRVSARIALQGAQVIACQPQDQRPLLWFSQTDPCRPDTALRGGIPLCWPWFANDRPGPAHGIARTSDWHLTRAHADQEGVRLVLTLPEEEISRQLPDEHWALEVEFQLDTALAVTLRTTNTGSVAQPLSQALHSYLPTEDIAGTSVHGLDGTQYMDKLEEGANFTQSGAVQLLGEVDRIYFGTRADILVHDGSDQLLIQRSGSNSVVVWNPWIEKSRQLSQFPPQGYLGMVCIEAANAGPDSRMLQPGECHALSTRISRPVAGP